MTKDEALKLALPAIYKLEGYAKNASLEFPYEVDTEIAKKDRVEAEAIITAIRKALAHPQQEAIYGINPDDWKDLTDAVKKVRDGRGMYLACQPADVFQDWFLWLGTAKIKERNT
jgi:TRAP-type C4-dicarboxylate transport system substrate-binding protein